MVCFFLFFPSCSCSAQTLQSANTLIVNGGYAISHNNTIIYESNLQTPFIPASTIKLLTSLAALKILGKDYRFSTKFFIDKENNLYIQGFGDPFLVSEKVQIIARMIAAKNITEINDIILDDFAFANIGETDGSLNTPEPYNANNSALAVNFNTIFVQIDQDTTIRSAELQTPYLPIMGNLGKNLSNGLHRINVDGFPKQQSISNSLQYCGELFQALLKKEHIQINGRIIHKRLPKAAVPLLTYTSDQSLNDLLRACLFSSSNFMANQIFLTMGLVQYGFPASWRKGQKAVNKFIQKNLNIPDKDIRIVEGSGISSKNQITPEAMIRILEKFKKHMDLLPIKYGTRMKSGTLTNFGVFCYAGYILAGNKLNPFVIFLNQKNNYRDKILEILSRQ